MASFYSGSPKKSPEEVHIVQSVGEDVTLHPLQILHDQERTVLTLDSVQSLKGVVVNVIAADDGTITYSSGLCGHILQMIPAEAIGDATHFVQIPTEASSTTAITEEVTHQGHFSTETLSTSSGAIGEVTHLVHIPTETPSMPSSTLEGATHLLHLPAETISTTAGIVDKVTHLVHLPIETSSTLAGTVEEVTHLVHLPVDTSSPSASTVEDVTNFVELPLKSTPTASLNTVESSVPSDPVSRTLMCTVTSEPSKSSILCSLLATTPLTKPSLPDAPSWVQRMNDCEEIGSSYRGWVGTEDALDLLLAYHKQLTHSSWGTRQSTSSLRSSLRLMWKSQYVPFDGIPFINAGSRAVVMECQYGPRRKRNPSKKLNQSQKGKFKQTCPARIYIKKVKKFPEYKVDPNLEKKSLHVAMEKAFVELKAAGIDGHGEERWYVQLPTEKAHEFHDRLPTGNGSSPNKQHHNIRAVKDNITKNSCLSRIHPTLVTKIRELVANGETKVLTIRKQLRKLVEHEMFSKNDKLPERHNLCFFPTIHDIQNHVFEALKDIRTGELPLLVPSVNIEVPNQSSSSQQLHPVNSKNVQPAVRQSQIKGLTVTLSKNKEPDQAPTITKIEVIHSDGSVEVNSTLTAETLNMINKITPASLSQRPFETVNSLPIANLNLPETRNQDPQSDIATIIFVPDSQHSLTSGHTSFAKTSSKSHTMRSSSSLPAETTLTSIASLPAMSSGNC
ncbi:calcium-responsive transcription factor-like [Limulus polyphemus]|uniref:Calcium-responsive transcription factor-like n=1 Tax=Limulus polyphemus TaxID=6850 RepID=A0ABM1S3W2_LIMPO|nr:calcium-responsive transcription factor-like [Limulus polyphemus]XP_022238319.1 calcium-responsive transcription factor-like [Limulus polyphemus]XP_022238320.1 calcium-responsive transcription factor-like [Limulus polyphemus]